MKLTFQLAFLKQKISFGHNINIYDGGKRKTLEINLFWLKEYIYSCLENKRLKKQTFE